MANIPDLSQGAGVPGQWSEDLTAVDVALVTGHEPALMTQDMIVAASQTIGTLMPVMKDANGRLVPAVSGTPAVGVAVIGITTTSSTTYKGAAVYRAGCLNPDKLNWPASYDTDAKKFAAFEGAPTPTNIILRRPKTASA